MDVSIIIVNYNTLGLTRECLSSISANTHGCKYEVIVVDNASNEDPSELTDLFPEITLIRSDKNLGFAGGNNLGIKKATGEYILLLNSDTEIIEGNDSISLCANFMEENKDVGVVSARLEYPDGSHQSAAQRFPGAKYKLYELLRLQKLMSSDKRGKVMLGAFFDHNSTVESDWVWGTFFMFRRQMLDSLPDNKLNEDYFMYGEDIQWCKDFRKRGWKVMYFPEARVLHHMGGSNAAKDEYMRESNDKFLRTNYSFLHRMFIRVLNALL